MSKLEIRLAGSGGQGIILATIILAERIRLNPSRTVPKQEAVCAKRKLLFRTNP